MFPTELAPLSESDRVALEARCVTYFRFVDAVHGSLYLGAAVGVVAYFAARLFPSVFAFGPRTAIGKGAVAGAVVVALVVLEHVLLTRREERERIGSLERDLREGEAELLRLPTIESVVMVAYPAIDVDEPEAGPAVGDQYFKVFLGFDGRTLVLDRGDEVAGDDAPALRGREVCLARGPASKAILPLRCSGEPLPIETVLDAAEDAPLEEAAWKPLHGELLECRPEEVRAVLAGEEPERRAFAWPDQPSPRD